MPPPQPRTVSPPCAARARRGLGRETPPFRVSAFLLVSLFFFLLCPAAVPATGARPQGQRMGRDVGHHADGSGGLHASSAAAIGVDHKDSSHSHNHPIEHRRPSAKPASRQLALMPGIHQLYALDPADGSIVWQFGDPENSDFMAAPAWVDGRIFVNDYFTVRALDPAVSGGGWGSMGC